MDRRNKFKHIFSLIIAIIGILSLLGGTSYAILKGSTTAENEQVIKAGSVELKLTENFENIDKKITVMSNVDGLLQEDVYDFNLKNIGSEPAEFKIKLANEVPSDYTGKVLEEKYFKVGLEINGEEYGPISLSEANNIIDNDIIYEREMISYKMRIWLDENKAEELLQMEDYKSFLKLSVEATQRPEEIDSGKTTLFNYTGDVQEYLVPRDGYYYIEMAGAQGGSTPTNYPGGKGTKTSGYVELSAGEKLYFYVGGKGTSGTAAVIATYPGGYNGGGNGYVSRATSNQTAASGGGATDVRLVKGDKKEKYRYVRNYLDGSNLNVSNHWVEIQVYDTKGTLISSGKTVTYNGTASKANYSNPQVITDGTTTAANYFDLDGGENTYVEIDLGAEYEIGRVVMWHYYSDSRIYSGNKVMLLNSEKTESVTMFDSDKQGTYAETSSGKTVYNVQDRESLISRIMVAAGGGGAYTEYVSTSDNANIYGGDGGTLEGEQAIYQTYAGYSVLNPTGGTQMSGGQGLNAWTATTYVDQYIGSFGQGGSGGNSYSGGGGGYYGGASGVWQPGSGGSSYISGYAGVNSVEESKTITHTNQTLHYSEKYFIGSKMIAGNNSGNGYAKITYVNSKPKRKNTELNDVRYVKNCTSYNTGNDQNHWVEFQAIKDGVNIAKGKTVTGTYPEANSTNYAYANAVDGFIEAAGSSGFGYSTTNSTNQCITIDLEEEYDLDEVAVWHSKYARSYYDNITYVSSDNSTWTKVIDEAAIETSNGQRMNAYTDTYNGYIQDGLELWYDGYANNGGTRTHNTKTWKNLANSSYTGTLTGGTWFDKYLYLDGSDDWVKIAAMNFATPTIEAVYNNTASTGNNEIIIGNINTGGYSLGFNSQQLISQFYIGTAYQRLYKAPLSLNKIESASMNYDQKTFKLYTNGNFYDKLDITGSIVSPTNSTVMAVGANVTGTTAEGEYFKGSVHSIRMYNRALTDEEIKHNYMYDREKFGLE